MGLLKEPGYLIILKYLNAMLECHAGESPWANSNSSLNPQSQKCAFLLVLVLSRVLRKLKFRAE